MRDSVAMDRSWQLSDVQDQTGRVAVVTGATSGLGLATAAALAGAGAHVVLTARSVAKGEAALRTVRAAHPDAAAEVMALDLTSLASIAAFGQLLSVAHPRVDVLINNAGIMATPLTRTEDGFESQIGTNHLGHCALTARMLPLLQAAPAGRVVTVSSLGHRVGSVDLADLNWERRRYGRWPAYFQSKLANLLFAFELDRRLRTAGSTVSSLAAHPGGTSTHLGTRQGGLLGKVQSAAFSVIGPMLMAADQGALCQLRAALDTSLEGGTYVGPNGFQEYRGRPTVVRAKAEAYDAALAAGLWELSNDLTGATYRF